jgi:hypothetical protein
MNKALPLAILAVALAGCQHMPMLQSALASAGSGFPGGVTALHILPKLENQFWVNGVANGPMPNGQPANWAFKFADPATHQPFTQFQLYHEKLMHLIVVSRDLSTFAHLHPTLDTARDPGTFRMQVNQASPDPDNADAAHAVTKPGPYLLFAEVKPVDHSRQAAIDLTTAGTEQPTPLVPDPVDANGAITKSFAADGTPGDAYQVTMTTTNTNGMVNYVFHLMQDDDRRRHYQPVSDLQPWLGMMGHGIMISQAGNTAKEKVYLHLHAGAMVGPMATQAARPQPVKALDAPTGGGTTGPDVTFMIMGDEIPAHGIYKFWGQFKRQNRILTFPFVIKL